MRTLPMEKLLTWMMPLRSNTQMRQASAFAVHHKASTPAAESGNHEKHTDACLAASFLQSASDIREAQRMRYRIFTSEYGAHIASDDGIDEDAYDALCLHLAVRDLRSGAIVGYTRLLPCDRLQAEDQFYSASEFDISAIVRLPGRKLEIGRTCIDPAYRSTMTIGVLWSALASYLLENNIRYLMGCASISMRDGGVAANAVMRYLREKKMTPAGMRTIPYEPVRYTPAISQYGESAMPALLKSYLRMGAKATGEAYWDTDFNVADVFILLDMQDLPARYRQHFMRSNTPAPISPAPLQAALA